MTAPWPGEWVTSRLGLALADGHSEVGLTLPGLVGLAVRRNPRRAHLLVSTVLGKHVPTDPRLVHGSALLLGRLVADALQPGPAGPGEKAGAFAEAALRGEPGAAAGLRDLVTAHRRVLGAVVVGYAETATALGHGVADGLGEAVYLHSTRRPVAEVTPYGGFEEEHSHATSHLLLPVPAGLLESDGPLVLVDDELSTGKTVRNTLRALHAVRSRRHYVVATLTDLRDEADRAAMAGLERELDARVDVVALVTGRVGLPPGVLEAGQELVARVEREMARADAPERVPGGLRRVPLGWPAGVPDGGRHGFLPEHRAQLEKELPGMAARLAAALPGEARRVLVLGFEELMYAPLRLAEALADLLEDTDVRYSTTTRSPVLTVDDPAYAIRNRLVFPAHDDPADGPGERYAYNVDQGFDAVVVVVDEAGDTPALEHGLLRGVRRLGAEALVAVVPS
ncbi:phosphoribosyltransferase family protein [Actinocorallia populi]|uniref:phosphoribosyltransferase family protein n=1 Tax=Actinocorallia populi TaxID=2079200 RepID=UPI0018E51A2A|nr:phosphoribosyltransferase family protein [Actinocorallia populi]